MLAANINDEELRINKEITICFAHVAYVAEIHHNVESTGSVNEVSDVDIEMKKSAIGKVVLKETLTQIPQNPSFMFQKDFYPE